MSLNLYSPKMQILEIYTHLRLTDIQDSHSTRINMYPDSHTPTIQTDLAVTYSRTHIHPEFTDTQD